MIINSQLGGKKPTGTKPITSNGVYDVTDYASADVQVPTTAPDHYILKTRSGTTLQNGNTFIGLSGVTRIGNSALRYAYDSNTNISGAIDMSGIQKIDEKGCYSFLAGTNVTSLDLSGLTEISNNGLYQGCNNCKQLTSVDLSSLKTVYDSGLSSTFNGCSALTSISLPSLTTITNNNVLQNLCASCTSLTSATLKIEYVKGSYMNGCLGSAFVSTPITSIDLSSFTLVDCGSAFNYTFNNCTSLASVDISNLLSISGNSAFNYTFQNCTALSSISFSKLCKVYAGGGSVFAYCFKGCNNIDISFGGLADNSNLSTWGPLFANMLNGTSGATVHFPSDLQTTISAWASTQAGFGGTNTTVLYDLPPVTTIDMSSIVETPSTISQLFNSMLQNYTTITKVDLRNLRKAAGSMTFYQLCYGCSALTTVDLSSLEEAGPSCFNNCFRNCTSLTTLSFPALKTANSNAFDVMLGGCTGVTVHFPSNLQATMGSWTSVTNGFSGTNTTVLFDLPATA